MVRKSMVKKSLAGAAVGVAAWMVGKRLKPYVITTDGMKTAPYQPRGIDRERLAKEGVAEEVIETLDARDGGNITPTGDVLFLDENRLKLREKPDRPFRENRMTGLGVKDGLAGKYATQIHDFAASPAALPKIVDMMAKPEGSMQRAAAGNFLGFEDSGYTHIQILPLDVDVAEGRHNVILPIDLIIQELRESEDIAILHECVCRTTFDCKEHPHDFGCIFTGPTAVHAIEMGLGRRVTVDEAIAHVKKAEEMGLMGGSEFIEGEQMFWGVSNDEMNRYRMFCFCCDCCCMSIKALRISSKDVSKRYAPVGWTATIDHDACVGCQACAPRCPQHCISYREDGKCVVDQDKCLGCGFCKVACEHGAVRIQQTMPMRENLNEYYLAEGRIDDGRPHAPAVANSLQA